MTNFFVICTKGNAGTKSYVFNYRFTLWVLWLSS